MGNKGCSHWMPALSSEGTQGKHVADGARNLFSIFHQVATNIQAHPFLYTRQVGAGGGPGRQNPRIGGCEKLKGLRMLIDRLPKQDTSDKCSHFPLLLIQSLKNSLVKYRASGFIIVFWFQKL